MSVKVETTVSVFGTTRVTGYVNNKEVISVSDNIQQTFHVGSSTCLPSNFELALLYVDCMKQVMQTVEAIKENTNENI